ncbi:M16 family metallopeptidase [Streptomyces luteogriseus]|uniref:M16 family metallopeptidase n=1 Tax=Streptomyces luteogriseus TaxID=68233 RepID=UPI00262C3936|nr:insulinase family protein [uncultured Streptomyces sp.]
MRPTAPTLPRPGRPAPVRAAPFRFPPVHRAVLANGVTLHTCDRPGQEVLSVEIIVKVPLALEARDLEGITGIAARALAEGTPRLPSLDFIQALEHCGATLGAGAEHAGMRITLDVPGPYVEHALGLVVAALREPLLPPRAVDRLARSQADAHRRHRADPERRASLEIHRALFDARDRRSRPALGDAETVLRVDRDAVAAHHARHVRPGATTVIVAGDLVRFDVDTVLHRVLSDWEGEQHAAGAPPVPPVPDEPAVILVDRPGAVQTRLVLGKAVPGAADPGWDALLVGNHCLGGSVNARLDRVLRERKGYTYGFHSRLVGVVEHSLAVVTGAVETSVTGAALSDIVTILEAAAGEDVSAYEHRAAIAQIVDAAPLRYLVPANVAEEIALLVLDGRDPAILTDVFTRAAAVTAAEASAALRSAFPPHRMVTVAVGDTARFAAQVRDRCPAPVTVLEG